MNAVVRIAEGNKTHEPLDVIRPDIKKLPTSKGSGRTSKFNGEAVLKFHEATKVGVILLLVRHDPSVGVIVELIRLFKEKEISKKNFMSEKKNQRK